MNYLIKDNKIYRKGTLAHFLDKRAIPEGEPTADDLPETINPFKFVRTNLLSNNCTIIKLKHSQMKYSSALLGLLSELLPSGQYVFIYIDVDDIKTVLGLRGATAVRCFETVSCTTNAPLYIQSDVVATRLEESCE